MSVLRLLAVVLVVGSSPLAAQNPVAVKSRGFNLFSRVLRQPFFVPTRTNRVDCGITEGSYGSVGGDVYFGCFWPRGVFHQYVFAGGLRVAGIVGPEATAWAGDTTGAMFYDPKGTTEAGTSALGLWYSRTPQDVAHWPDAARVPNIGGEIYRPELRGGVSASDGDIWYLVSETDVNQAAGRPHPLGLAIETRYLQFTRPRGNEDILYAVHTFYNITATDPAAYAAIRPELRPTLLALAEKFHRDVSSNYGVDLPAGGYTIQQYYTDIVTDADIAGAFRNFSTVNLPLSVGFTWDPAFPTSEVGTYDASDNGEPFFAGEGFYGTKVLAAPAGGNAIEQFNVTFNGTVGVTRAPDALNLKQLYRYLNGTGSPDLIACNTGDPLVTHVCFLTASALDVRQQVATAGGDLAPGRHAVFAVAYLFAAPYRGCGGACNVGPGDPTRWLDPALLALGVNPIDTLTGYTGFTDLNSNGLAEAGEIRAAPRSLLGKAELAQAIFDGGFLVPSAPVAPAFYLVPGNNQVTVLWRPSVTETTGDPYFDLASTPTRVAPGGAPSINPLYDPNFRKFDVEGYRIYRGRTANPAEMVQVATFDYAGTSIDDYTGRIAPVSGCAPELGIRAACPVAFDSLIPGQPLTVHRTLPISFQVVQVRDGDRVRIPGNSAAVIHADTVGGLEESNCLCDRGVPFIFEDKSVLNGSEYFYVVTAFDVNSLQSGPGSMESLRQVKSVRPRPSAVNLAPSTAVSVTLEGRGRVLDTSQARPTWDPATGRLSGPYPPATAWAFSFANLAREVVEGEYETRIRLDSLSLGQVDARSAFVNALEGIPVQLHLSVTSGASVTHLSVPLPTPRVNDVAAISERLTTFSADSAASLRYRIPPLPVYGDLSLSTPPPGYNGEWGSGFTTSTSPANGARWFDGPSPARNEVASNPTAGNCSGNGSCLVPTFKNAGTLTGVTTVYQPRSYITLNRSWRNMGLALVGAHRGADYNVYWGVGGAIDSVIDITHNVPVPFSLEAGGTWGILNTSAQGAGGFDNRPTVLTPYDWTCVEPFRSRLTLPTNVWFPCSSSAPFRLSRQAELGSIAFAYGDTLGGLSARDPANLSPEPGFALYLAGTITEFGMNALPSVRSVWTMRDYVGYIDGFSLSSFYSSPWTAVGTELVIRVSASNTPTPVASRDLRRVHTVPDPFYFTSDILEGPGVRFVNLPAAAVVRIYSAGGTLVRILEHNDPALTDNTFWDLRSRNGQRVASGVYFYHIESGSARRIGRMTVVNFVN